MLLPTWEGLPQLQLLLRGVSLWVSLGAPVALVVRIESIDFRYLYTWEFELIFVTSSISLILKSQQVMQNYLKINDN